MGVGGFCGKPPLHGDLLMDPFGAHCPYTGIDAKTRKVFFLIQSSDPGRHTQHLPQGQNQKCRRDYRPRRPGCLCQSQAHRRKWAQQTARGPAGPFGHLRLLHNHRSVGRCRYRQGHRIGTAEHQSTRTATPTRYTCCRQSRALTSRLSTNAFDAELPV
jgi:hypothetical protein